MKTCFKCGVEKPLTDFYAHPQMPDGYLNKCKECNKKDVRENYAKRREQYHAYEKVRCARPERRASIAKSNGNRSESARMKRRARYAIGNAVAHGRIKKLPCETCGSIETQAHHDDYSKPLDVRWLCFKCHREHAHGQVVTCV